LAAICACLLATWNGSLLAQQPSPAPPAASPAPEAKKLPADQLDSLVAPIALYPDALLAQTLASSTYPLEIVQLSQWLAKNKSLKEQALMDAVAKQPWDPSVQAMAPFPDAVKRLADDIQWTAQLGNAFLAQQGDVMDAVQRMRKKAKDKGTLASNEQQKVETQVIEKKEIIIIESASPQVIYVPAYDPVVVYGPPVYPYPPIYYPYYPVGAAFVSFGIGVMWGAFWGGMWGGCGWGGSNININVNNNFNRVEHHGGNRGNVGDGGRGNAGAGGGRGQGGANWKHNPQHRGGTPYGDRATANKYGGNARGDSLANRQAGARQQINRSGAPSASNRASGTGNRGSGGGVGGGGVGGGGAGGAGVSNRASGSFNRSGSADRIGGRDLGSGASRGPSGLGGGYSGGFSGNRSRASSSRGSSSFGGRAGGGGGGRRR
jgi:hypothetical protein